MGGGFFHQPFPFEAIELGGYAAGGQAAVFADLRGGVAEAQLAAFAVAAYGQRVQDHLGLFDQGFKVFDGMLTEPPAQQLEDEADGTRIAAGQLVQGVDAGGTLLQPGPHFGGLVHLGQVFEHLLDLGTGEPAEGRGRKKS